MASVTEKSTTNAYLRDGALILYFDMAETPFISRFDLDSLAQANFEVADKKDGIYSLVLRDYTGQVQTIGQFSSKADAHQALYAILKALLSHKENAGKTCGSVSRFFKGVLKFLAALILFVLLLSCYVWLRSPVKHHVPGPAPVSQNDAVGKAPDAAPAIPQGEAVDADEFLKNTIPAAPAPTPVEPPKE